jgi:hypothetical protein
MKSGKLERPASKLEQAIFFAVPGLLLTAIGVGFAYGEKFVENNPWINNISPAILGSLGFGN